MVQIPTVCCRPRIAHCDSMGRSMSNSFENATSCDDRTAVLKEGISATMTRSHDKIFTISILIPPKPKGMDPDSRPSSPPYHVVEGDQPYAEGPCTIGTFQVMATSSQVYVPTEAGLHTSATSMGAPSNFMSLTQHDELARSTLPFVWKLYEMLEDMERTSREDIVSWVNGGRAFKVYKMTEFVNTIIPKYFKHSQFKSFQRQLVRSDDHGGW